MTSNKSSNCAKKAAVLSVLTVLLLVSPRLFSQAAVGTIHGGVFDSTGGAISGAMVTVTDVDRGTNRVLTTDAAGEYTAPSLLVGTYSVRAVANGFQTLEHANVVLSVAADVRVDLTLMPGSQAQSVTVTEEAPAIDTSDATLGGVITNESITALPLISRDFLGLLQMRPGIVDVPGTGTGVATSTNGRREGADVLVIEGVTQFDLRGGGVLINGANKGGSVDFLPIDAIAEFTTQENSPAEYGWKDGADINVAVKSGTNALHGSAYAFGRDASATDAKNYSPTGNGQTSQLTVEQPGFTLGGPILKNKLFFFVSAEFFRQTSINTLADTVPSAFPGLGPNSSIVDACNAIGRAKVNPLSAQIAGLPAGSCTPLPATSTFEDVIPYNFSSNTTLVFPDNATISPSNNGLAKIDWSPNQYNHVSGMMYISRETLTANGVVQPYWGSYGIGRTNQYDLGWTWTPNSSWVNDLRAGAAPNFGTQNGIDQGAVGSVSGAFYATSPYALGPDGVPTGYSINNGVTATSSLTSDSWGGFPCVSISGFFTSAGATALGCSGGGYTGPQGQINISDKVSHIFGNHSLKFGWEEVYNFFDNSTTGDGAGLIAFTTLGNFLTGTTNSGIKRTGDNEKRYRLHWHAAFVQDTWRVTKNITLSPGIRWEYFGPPTAENCAPSTTCSPGIGNFNPNVPGGVQQQGGPGLPPMFNGDYTNFNPRMGVAWDIFGNGRTVLRGGVGNFSAFQGILTQFGTSVPWAATLCTGNPCTPANTVINRSGTQANNLYSETINYSKGQLDPTWTTACTNTLVTSTCSGPQIFPITPGACTTGTGQCSMLVPSQNLKDARSVQWNIDLQRALTNQLTLDVAYVGVHGYDEPVKVDVNEPGLGTGWDASAVTSCLGAMASAVNSWKSNCAEDTANVTAMRPYATAFPYYSFIDVMQSIGRSNYNGLQVTLTARNYHGLNAVASYTYSHALDDLSVEGYNPPTSADPGNPNYPYGNSDMDVRNLFRFSPSYKLPGIKSPGQMLEGWTISGVWALQNGFAWSPDDSKNVDWAGTGQSSDGNGGGIFQDWNYLGPRSAFNKNGINPVPCYGQLAGCQPLASNVAVLNTCLGAAQAPYGTAQLKALAVQSMTSTGGACYIENGGVLTPPAYGTVGDAPRGLFTGPLYQDVDLVVEKDWKIKERYSTQFRVECYNVFNHVNLAQFASSISSPATPGELVGSTGFGHSIGSQGNMRQFQFGLKFLF